MLHIHPSQENIAFTPLSLLFWMLMFTNFNSLWTRIPAICRISGIFRISEISREYIPGNDGYYASVGTGPSSATPKVQYKSCFKSPSKLIKWIAMSEKGIRVPYFVPAKHAMKGTNYRKEFITDCLTPFLNQNHPDDNHCF